MNPKGATKSQAEPSVEGQDVLRFLDDDGSLRPGVEKPADRERILQAFRLMLLTRLLNERAVNLQRQGRIGTIASARGQEAAIVGSALAVDPARDWVVPQYRELPALYHMGLPLDRILLYFRGHPLGAAIPEGVNALPIQIALAAHLPHAVGLAWGLALQQSDAVVVTYFGEGSASEGDAHEALNFAGVLRAPVVFILQDNGWAISTPRSKQSAAERLAIRAAGYGFPGESVDGNDLLAMLDATQRAVTRAREGHGPTLIEAKTYRLGPHNTVDDHTRYQDAAEIEAWEAHDPLDRVRGYLRAEGILDDDGEQELKGELTEEIGAAVKSMESVPEPALSELFENAYAKPFGRLLKQQRTATPGSSDEAIR